MTIFVCKKCYRTIAKFEGVTPEIFTLGFIGSKPCDLCDVEVTYRGRDDPNPGRFAYAYVSKRYRKHEMACRTSGG